MDARKRFAPGFVSVALLGALAFGCGTSTRNAPSTNGVAGADDAGADAGAREERDASPPADAGECGRIFTGNVQMGGNTVGLPAQQAPTVLTEQELEGVSEIQGSLIIAHADTLASLHCLKKVTGALEIGATSFCPVCPPFEPALQDLHGLELLEEIGDGLRVNSVSKLRTFDGLEGLRVIKGGLSIIASRALESIAALRGVTKFDGALWISDAMLLEDLSGLDGITALSDLHLEGDKEAGFDLGFKSLHGLEGLTRLGGLTIIDAPNLKSLQALSKVTDFEGAVQLTQLDSLESIDGPSTAGRLVSIDLVEDAALTNLDGLSNLLTVDATVHLENLRRLESVSGVRALQTVGDTLSLVSLPALASLSGFESLRSVGGLTLETLPALTNVDALSHLRSIGKNGLSIKSVPIETLAPLEGVTGTVGEIHVEETQLSDLTGLGHVDKVKGLASISNNEVLTSLSGLDGLNSVAALSLDSNRSLTSLAGLSSLTSIGDTTAITITNSPLLPQCQAQAFADRFGATCVTPCTRYCATCSGLDEQATCR